MSMFVYFEHVDCFCVMLVLIARVDVVHAVVDTVFVAIFL